MPRTAFMRSGWLRAALALGAIALIPAMGRPADPAAQEAFKLRFEPSLQLRFVAGQARNYFLSQASVVNVSGAPMTDLTMRQAFPEGFTPKLISQDAQAVFKRPAGYSETLENNTLVIKMAELRVAEATTLAVELNYQGRPAGAAFKGIEVEYTQDGARHKEKGPDLSWDLSKYTRYSGTLREFIRRYAGMELRIPDESEDWGFSSLAARTAGKVATGPVEIDMEPSGRCRFSLQAGTPGTLRQVLVIRRPFDPSRMPKANDEARRLVTDTVQASADFVLDTDNISVRRQKVGRFDAWLVDTRWRDRVKDRLGEGPSRWYIFADERNASQYILNISAQGRGAGPGRADAPNPDRENELMSQLEGIVASLRIL